MASSEIHVRLSRLSPFDGPPPVEPVVNGYWTQLVTLDRFDSVKKRFRWPCFLLHFKFLYIKRRRRRIKSWTIYFFPSESATTIHDHCPLPSFLPFEFFRPCPFSHTHNNNNRREEEEEEGDGRAEVPRLCPSTRKKKKHLKNQGDFPGKKDTKENREKLLSSGSLRTYITQCKAPSIIQHWSLLQTAQ